MKDEILIKYQKKGIANRRRHFSWELMPSSVDWWYYDTGCWMRVFRCTLVAVAETHWKFKPVLAGKGSSGSDRFSILSYQALHIHFCFLIMDPEEITACFKRFWEIHLIYMFGFFFFNITGVTRRKNFWIIIWLRFFIWRAFNIWKFYFLLFFVFFYYIILLNFK